MPTITDVIDAVATPPLASLQQVLDTGGPYGPGSHYLQNFTTNGAFLLPAGTYGISGTYGVLTSINGAIPPQLGFSFGFNDATLVSSGDEYHQRFVQVCLLHQLPITGAFIITETHDVNLVQQLFLWPSLIGSAARLGLYVAPGIHIDLFYLCVL
jgi:hypothetical protein